MKVFPVFKENRNDEGMLEYEWIWETGTQTWKDSITFLGINNGNYRASLTYDGVIFLSLL